MSETDASEVLLNMLYNMGGWMVEDDIKDYGKCDRLHHWQAGEALKQLSFLAYLGLIGAELAEGEEEFSFEDLAREWGELK